MQARVVGASCLSPLSLSWRGLADLVANDRSPTAASVPLRSIPDDHPRQDRMAERLMSRAAMLGHLAVRAAITDARWDRDSDCTDVGVYMGVGASGGSTQQLEAMLSASDDAGAFSLDRFGRQGLRACNPLYAFQLMNNFAMCHAAILSGLGGPNMALFSRGGGTVHALVEALFALEDPAEDCGRVLVGGTDTAIDPVTAAELCRQGYVAEGLVPTEGAAILALTRKDAHRSLATITHAMAAPSENIGLRATLASLLPEALGKVDAVVLSAWGPARRHELRELSDDAMGAARVVDVTQAVGETLAAAPAVGWTVAIDLLQDKYERVAALSCGVDDELGLVVFAQSPTQSEGEAFA